MTERISRLGSSIFGLFVIVLLLVMIGGMVAAWDAMKEAGVIIIYFTTGLIIVAGAGWGARYLWRILMHMIVARSNARIRQNEARLSDLEVERAQRRSEFEFSAMLAVLPQIKAGLIYPNKLGDIAFASHTSAMAKMTTDNQGVPLLEAPLRPLIPNIAQAQRGLIVGGPNAGKTTVLLHLTTARLAMGRVIAIDSHTTPAKWPAGVEVIGAKRNYHHIEALLRWLLREMDRRYTEMAEGIVPERGHPIITVVSDEWTILPDVIEDIKQYTKPLLTESRKVAIDFFLAAHDTTVEVLGLQGVSGLKKAFDVVVFCDHDHDTGDHRTLVSFDGVKRSEAKEFKSPGPYVIHGIADPAQEPLDLAWSAQTEQPENSEPIRPNEEEMAAIVGFVTVRDSGDFSWNKATQAAFGEGRFGRNYQDKLKRILDKFNIDYSELEASK